MAHEKIRYKIGTPHNIKRNRNVCVICWVLFKRRSTHPRSISFNKRNYFVYCWVLFKFHGTRNFHEFFMNGNGRNGDERRKKKLEMSCECLDPFNTFVLSLCICVEKFVWNVLYEYSLVSLRQNEKWKSGKKDPNACQNIPSVLDFVSKFVLQTKLE